MFFLFFFFNDTATTEIYTLSLHDALPISLVGVGACFTSRYNGKLRIVFATRDRKSTRLNSSHSQISYAVFCLKKKKNKQQYIPLNLYSYHSMRHLASLDTMHIYIEQSQAV